jgi:hypothetical protein
MLEIANFDIVWEHVLEVGEDSILKSRKIIVNDLEVEQYACFDVWSKI